MSGAKQVFLWSWLDWTARLDIWRCPDLALNRRTDPRPTNCDCCGWIGRRRDAVHGFGRNYYGQSVEVEKCPNCKADL